MNFIYSFLSLILLLQTLLSDSNCLAKCDVVGRTGKQIHSLSAVLFTHFIFQCGLVSQKSWELRPCLIPMSFYIY